MKRSDILPAEYNEYYTHYLNLVPETALIEDVLNIGLEQSLHFISNIKVSMDYSYDVNKWTVAQVILHNIDTERIFAYRALRFMRGDQTALPGFDQDIFASDYENYAFAKADLIKSFTATRNATIELFRDLSQDRLLRQGIASGSVMSVRVIPFLIAGHTKHHENVLEERYL